MLSKSKTKFIHSLENKKKRDQLGLFVAEGSKVVGDLLETMPAELILATSEWISGRQGLDRLSGETIEVDGDELRKASFMQAPQQVLAVFKKKQQNGTPSLQGKLSLALDGVQDPGNVGTIIRIADWFGIETIYCSHETADVYNPKVVQSTMGSLARVDVVYTDLCKLADNAPEGFPIYGTLLDGENIYGKQLKDEGLIVMGNEGKGISPEMRKRINQKLYIPNFPITRKTADSLNVATATAVVCSEFRRSKQISML